MHKLLLFQVIDASMNVEDVHKHITEHSLNAVNVAQNLPLGELWQSHWAEVKKPTSQNFCVVQI